jgi:hypothetical protein
MRVERAASAPVRAVASAESTEARDALMAAVVAKGVRSESAAAREAASVVSAAALAVASPAIDEAKFPDAVATKVDNAVSAAARVDASELSALARVVASAVMAASWEASLVD